MIFDTHAHYDDKAFDEDRKDLLLSLKDSHIKNVINIGVDIKNSIANVEFVNKYDYMYGAVGVHPNEVGNITDADMDTLRELTKNNKIVAIGEIGLDYYYDQPEKEVQKIWFEKQIELAREVALPISVHSRDAAKDTLDMMVSTHCENIGGVIHCFSYGKDMAREFMKMNYFFGVGGVVTFKNSKKLKEAVEYIPIENIVVETDCPYLAPDPYRGKRNLSAYLPYVIDKIAEIKAMTREEVMDITYRNACRLYKLEL